MFFDFFTIVLWLLANRSCTHFVRLIPISFFGVVDGMQGAPKIGIQ